MKYHPLTQEIVHSKANNINDLTTERLDTFIRDYLTRKIIKIGSVKKDKEYIDLWRELEIYD